jgi:DNA replicative helicase MCM subunit Mcm2 (Cdc46/Mcm family)
MLAFCPSGDIKGQGRDRPCKLTGGIQVVKFQELKLQELPSQVPLGHVHEYECVLSGLTRLASPGDVVTVDGVFYRSDWRKWLPRHGGRTFIFDNVPVLRALCCIKESYDESLLDTLSEEERQVGCRNHGSGDGRRIPLDDSPVDCARIFWT